MHNVTFSNKCRVKKYFLCAKRGFPFLLSRFHFLKNELFRYFNVLMYPVTLMIIAVTQFSPHKVIR